MLPVDKQLHLLGGYVITLTLAPIGIWTALAACTLIAAAKELVHDYAMKRGTPEVMDWLATVAGGLAALITYSVSR